MNRFIVPPCLFGCDHMRFGPRGATHGPGTGSHSFAGQASPPFDSLGGWRAGGRTDHRAGHPALRIQAPIRGPQGRPARHRARAHRSPAARRPSSGQVQSVRAVSMAQSLLDSARSTSMYAGTSSLESLHCPRNIADRAFGKGVPVQSSTGSVRPGLSWKYLRSITGSAGFTASLSRGGVKTLRGFLDPRMVRPCSLNREV